MAGFGALQGLRVLDLGWAMAGPQAMGILAAYGADVIKVESRARLDLARTTFGPIMRPDDPENGSGYFTNFNRNKRSITLNMTSERGRQLFAQLLAVSDGLLENFSAGVLSKWGFPYAEMARIRPDIVYVSMAGFGHTGPYRDYQTFGPTVQAVSGLTHLSGFPERPPAGWGFSYMDHTGGYMGAIAMLQALLHRRRTGQGQHVDLAQVEAAITLTGTAVLDKVVNGRASARAGNAAPETGACPHGVYRCAPDADPRIGDDAWVAIAVETDEQWQALCEVIDASDLAAEPGLHTPDGRRAARAAIDAAIDAWTRPRDAAHATEVLQAAGVPAGMVQRSRDLAETDPQIAHRGMRPQVTHEVIGTVTVDGVPVRFSRTPAELRTAGPMLGGHNAEVYGDLLGLSSDEVRCLEDEQVLW